MGQIYTAECHECNRIYNFDVGISRLYGSDKLLDLNSDFNLLKLFKEKNRKEELRQILERGKCELLDGYGHKIVICNRCKSMYSRFLFTLKEGDNEFSPKYLCHNCRRKLRELTDHEILNDIFQCQYCKNSIKFHKSGEWN